MREEFEKLVAAGKLDRQHLECLVNLTTSGYCLHRSWGFGKITTVDTVFARFTIDFIQKPGHQMDLGFAATSLKPIDPTHILARKAANIEAVRQMAALNHLDLIKIVLQSYEGKANVDQIQQVLVPDVIADDWKKWWEVAKKELKKDGHFLVPSKKTDPIVFQKQEVPLKDRLITDFRSSKGLKAKIIAATEALKNVPDLDEAKVEVATEVIAGLNADIASHQRTQPAVALEGIFVREDLRQATGVPAVGAEISADEIWKQGVKLHEILAEVPVAKQKAVLDSFKTSNPTTWPDIVLHTLNGVSIKLCGECIAILNQEGKLGIFKETMLRLINQHLANSDLLLWLAKNRSDQFADILGPEVFRAMLSSMERDQFAERRSNKLRDYILSDQELLIDLIGSADLEVIKDLTRTLQLSPCFDDMDKRSLLARIVKSYPAVQSLISGETSKQDNTLIVSWDSLERRRKEYETLVQKTIPANSKEIAIARSYGDLRENHEYKAAKEMQKLLMKRKAELESELVRSRGTDFANPNTDVVSIGTRVSVTDLNHDTLENFIILGAWDGNPDKGIISYLTPVAQAMLNCKVGDEIEFNTEGSVRKLRINAIAAVPILPKADTSLEEPAEPEPVTAHASGPSDAASEPPASTA